jgi:hypothetical protein
MNPTEIQGVDAKVLCFAYASYKRNYKPVPTIDAEVARRGLACKDAIESMVSNCDSLSIVSQRSEPIRLNSGSRVENGTAIYVTVKNNSNKPKYFRISAQNISSENLTIKSRATSTYNIFVNKTTFNIAAVMGIAQGSAGREPKLYDCVTPW